MVCFLSEFTQWSTVVLSVHKNLLDTGMVRELRISSFKRVASDMVSSSNFGRESAFIGATLAFQIRRKVEFGVTFSHGREENLQHKKKFFRAVTEHVYFDQFNWYVEVAAIYSHFS